MISGAPRRRQKREVLKFRAQRAYNSSSKYRINIPRRTRLLAEQHEVTILWAANGLIIVVVDILRDFFWENAAQINIEHV